jgi:hypothetical protein
MKKGTKTSSFGVSKREGHDSSQFYNSKLYDGLIIDKEQELADNSREIDPLIYGRKIKFEDGSMASLPDFSVHLFIYLIPELRREDISKDSRFYKRLESHFDFMNVKLASGGRIALLVDNILMENNGLKMYYPLHQIINSICQAHGLLMRGEIILLSPPCESENGQINSMISNGELESLQHKYSRALIYSKQNYARKKTLDDRGKLSDSIERDAFLDSTKSVWSPLSSDSESFYLSYLKRICELYSFVEDTISVISRQAIDLHEVRKKIIYVSI